MNQGSTAAREAGIEEMVSFFEDRLTSPKPEAGSWAELSRMLNGAPPWRAELNRRWGGRADWKAFLQWEISYQAEQWNKDSLPAGRFPKPIRPRGNQGRERILVEFTPGVRGWFEPVEFLSDEIAIIECPPSPHLRMAGLEARRLPAG